MFEAAQVSKQQSSQGFALEVDKIVLGDCLNMLKTFPDGCIDLIITSPPYADNRKKSYKGIPIKQYVAWFLPISTS